MLAYCYSPYTGDYVGSIEINEDPLDPGNWLVPGSATLVEPPPYNDATQTCRWNGTEWVVAAIVIDPEILIGQQLSQINETRDLALVAGVTHNGMQFYVDTGFVTELSLTLGRFSLGILPASATVFVRTMSSGTIECDLDDVKAIAEAVGAYRAQVYKTFWDAKDLVDPAGQYGTTMYARGA